MGGQGSRCHIVFTVCVLGVGAQRQHGGKTGDQQQRKVEIKK
jgi:hypothetical protein